MSYIETLNKKANDAQTALEKRAGELDALAADGGDITSDQFEEVRSLEATASEARAAYEDYKKIEESRSVAISALPASATENPVAPVQVKNEPKPNEFRSMISAAPFSVESRATVTIPSELQEHDPHVARIIDTSTGFLSQVDLINGLELYSGSLPVTKFGALTVADETEGSGISDSGTESTTNMTVAVRAALARLGLQLMARVPSAEANIRGQLERAYRADIKTAVGDAIEAGGTEVTPATVVALTYQSLVDLKHAITDDDAREEMIWLVSGDGRAEITKLTDDNSLPIWRPIQDTNGIYGALGHPVYTVSGWTSDVSIAAVVGPALSVGLSGMEVVRDDSRYFDSSEAAFRGRFARGAVVNDANYVQWSSFSAS